MGPQLAQTLATGSVPHHSVCVYNQPLPSHVHLQRASQPDVCVPQAPGHCCFLPWSAGLPSQMCACLKLQVISASCLDQLASQPDVCMPQAPSSRSLLLPSLISWPSHPDVCVPQAPGHRCFLPWSGGLPSQMCTCLKLQVIIASFPALDAEPGGATGEPTSPCRHCRPLTVLVRNHTVDAVTLSDLSQWQYPFHPDTHLPLTPCTTGPGSQHVPAHPQPKVLYQRQLIKFGWGNCIHTYMQDFRDHTIRESWDHQRNMVNFQQLSLKKWRYMSCPTKISKTCSKNARRATGEHR